MAALDELLSVGNGRNNLKVAYNLQADMIASPIYAPRLLDPGASQKRILTVTSYLRWPLDLTTTNTNQLENILGRCSLD